MQVSTYVVWFVLYSVLGWVWETVYCTVKERTWNNRGFLYGPICPIYGTGMTGALLLCQAAEAARFEPTPAQAFVVCALLSAVLEYVTSWTLEQLFGARWWDYSDMPLNLNGRICLPATLLFGGVGTLFALYLYQPTLHALDGVPSSIIQVCALAFVALIAVDATLTATALTRFSQIAAAYAGRLDAQMGQVVDSLSCDAEHVLQSSRQSIDDLTRSAVARIHSFRSARADAFETLRRSLRRS